MAKEISGSFTETVDYFYTQYEEGDAVYQAPDSPYKELDRCAVYIVTDCKVPDKFIKGVNACGLTLDRRYAGVGTQQVRHATEENLNADFPISPDIVEYMLKSAEQLRKEYFERKNQ